MMNRVQETSALGLKLIKAFEGYRGNASTLATGQRVIGYGHPLDSNENMNPLSKDEADSLLRQDLAPVEQMVRETVFSPLSQSQFDALVSLVFNIGPINFMTSNIRHALNNGRTLDAAYAFDEWRKADIDGKVYVVDALVRRRTAEKALFLRPDKGLQSANYPGLSVQSDDTYDRINDDEVYSAASKVGAGVVNPKRPGEGNTESILTLSERPLDAKTQNVKAQTETVLNTSHSRESGDTTLHDAVNSAPKSFETADSGHVETVSQDMGFGDFDDMNIPHPSAKKDNISKPSPIALAAVEVSERLDALIDTARLDTLKQVEPFAVSKSSREGSPRSDLPVAANNNAGKARRAAQNHENASTRIIKRDVSTLKAANSGANNYAYFVFIFLGGCLASGGALLWARESDSLGELGGFLVTWSIVFGAAMLLGGLYYAIKGAQKPQKKISNRKNGLKQELQAAE